ncbi:phosphotransacetylase family protein [Puniceicoccus vermicola]|uniref:phosphotransacetylase family protein n=1 Tax=Puniceicoccus vermicola TaxID=388746 RepID=UPI001FE54581|nr:AAA family ATPase [Puniceicoccus vermicola]
MSSSASQKSSDDEARYDSENSISIFSSGNEPLISAPKNTTTKRIFVAATRQNQGKTTTSLGLFGGMKKFSPHVGYIKPIGQRFVQIEGQKIDEDSVLFDSVYDLDVPIGAISPVAIDGRMTRWYLDNPGRKLEHLIDLICRAFDRAAFNKDYIIIEGSGHAGVGSVFDLSNAAIARILGAKAIIVSEGGIGSPVDEIAMNKALFDQFGVEVIGAIINKVLPEKLDLIREYAGKGLERLGIPLLGCLPLRKRLQAPTFSQVVKEINGRWLNGAEHGMTERILRVVIGAMTAKGVVDYIQPGVLIITPGDREDVLFSAIASANISKKQVVSGIILTRNILPHPKLMDLISMTEIPVVICSEESYTVASKINNMTVKTQPTDEDKIPIIQEIVAEHTDMERIRDAFTEGKPNRK